MNGMHVYSLGKIKCFRFPFFVFCFWSLFVCLFVFIKIWSVSAEKVESNANNSLKYVPGKARSHHLEKMMTKEELEEEQRSVKTTNMKTSFKAQPIEKGNLLISNKHYYSPKLSIMTLTCTQPGDQKSFLLKVPCRT